MSLVTRLTDTDRRLPAPAGLVVGLTAAAVLLAGTVTAFTKESDPATVAQGGPSASPTAAASVTATPSAAPTKAAPTKPPKPDDPSDYLLDITTAFPDYDRLGDRIAGAGPMDLDDAAYIEAGGEKPTDKDREVLRDLGYVRGHSRAWTDGDTTVVVFVYEWKGTDGPLTFVRGMEEVNKGTSAGWKPPIKRSYGVCKKQGDQLSDGVLAAVGKHSLLVITLRDGTCAKHEPVTKMADLMVKHATSLGA